MKVITKMYKILILCEFNFRYSFYYITCFIETIICVSIYAVYVEENFHPKHIYFGIIAMSIIPYVLGICFMILYYSKYHPKKITVVA